MSSRRRDKDPTIIRVAVYLVFQRQFSIRGDRQNTKIIASRLTHADAKKVVNEIPGTYIEKVYASKHRAGSDAITPLPINTTENR